MHSRRGVITSLRWRWLLAIAIVSCGVGASWLASRRSSADFSYLYFLARSLRDGNNAYDPAFWPTVAPFEEGPPPGIYYPPTAGLVAFPFGLLSSYRVSLGAWFATVVVAVVGGIRALGRSARPPVDPAVWLTATGVLLLSSTARWGMTGLNAVVVVFGLLCAFLVFIDRGQRSAALVIALIVALLKPSVLLPFLGLFVLYRYHVEWLAVLVATPLANVACFARLGGLPAFHAYRAQMSTLESLGNLNTPDPSATFSVPRADLKYFFYGLGSGLQVSSVLPLLIGALLGAWLLSVLLRAPRGVSRAQAATVSMVLSSLSLIVSYHHHYDLLMVFAPFVLACFDLRMRAVLWQRRALILPLLAILVLLPISVLQRLLLSVLGTPAIWIVNMLFPLATILATLTGLLNMQGLGVPERQAEPDASVV